MQDHLGENVMRALEMCTSSPTMQCRKPVGTLSVPHVIPQLWFATGTLGALDVSLYAQLIGRQTMGTDSTHAGRVLNHSGLLWLQTSERIVLKKHGEQHVPGGDALRPGLPISLRVCKGAVSRPFVPLSV
jgi:hypothetical protein